MKEIDFADDRALRLWCIEKALSYPEKCSLLNTVKVARELYELLALPNPQATAGGAAISSPNNPVHVNINVNGD